MIQYIGLQALMSVQPELPQKELWQQRVMDIHRTWGGGNLTTRDNDISPGTSSCMMALLYEIIKLAGNTTASKCHSTVCGLRGFQKTCGSSE
jgi:hypothetical protein